MRKKTYKLIIPIIFSLFIIGCGGGASDKKISEPPVITTPSAYSVSSSDEASAFLSRATFGTTKEDIDAIIALGDYETWIDKQFSIRPNFHLVWVKDHAIGINGVGDLKNYPQDWTKHSDALAYMQRDAWWDIAVKGKDQLRQRVAFALSEILVISRNGPLLNFPDARLSYYDVLVKHAFDNFENLLQSITYHPAMGKYLSYLGNAKAGSLGEHPDENYAREVMQLFSIGLYQLNLDGSRKLQKGKPIPTYDQHDIEQLAKVFTGLSDDNGEFESEASFSSHQTRISPMAAFEEYHDVSEKKILLGKKTIAASGDAKADINMALQFLFKHPNTGPFISKQLIQRLVTSNPTPAYVQRVSAKFNNNGEGIRGDLKAVVKAILLDKEALQGASDMPKTFGKFREPLLYFTHLFRAFHAKNAENILYQEDEPLYKYRSFNFSGTAYTKQEGALEALTVFNYFTPEDAPYALKKQGLVAPELEAYGKEGIDQVLMGLINEDEFIYKLFNITASLQLSKETIMLQQKKYDALLDHLNLVLAGNNLSLKTQTAIKKYIQKHIDDADMTDKKMVRHTIGLVMTSPDYALQR